MGMVRILLAVSMLAALGCDPGSKGGQVAGVPMLGTAGLSGSKVGADVALASLPETAYFQVMEPIRIDLRGLQKIQRLNQAVAYFQSNGQVRDEDGSVEGWDGRGGRDGRGNGGRRVNSLQSRQKVCSLSIDLGKVLTLIRAGEQSVLLPAGLQLQISRKVATGRGQNGEVNFEFIGNTAAVENLGCDKMSVQALEQNIFKNRLQVFVR